MGRTDVDVDVVVIGAGQAGLSSAYFLRHRGFEPFTDFVVLDANAAPGGAWQHRWPSLRFGTTHEIHPLPGMPLEGVDAQTPASEVVARYFAEHEAAFDLPVVRPVQVGTVRDAGDGRLAVESDTGTWVTRALINATGTWTKPFWPSYPGRAAFAGRQLHAAEYRSADDFAGQHVVVVGGGHSAVQLLAEIAEVGTTTWVTRRPPVWREAPFDEKAGRSAVALVERAVREGRPPDSVVSVTGLAVTPTVEAARRRGVYERLPMFDRITPDGVAWDDGRPGGRRGAQTPLPWVVRADAILWATGFRAALDHLAPLGLRERSGGIRMNGTRTASDPRVHLVGYGPSASTVGATRAGRAAVAEVRDLLGHGAPARRAA